VRDTEHSVYLTAASTLEAHASPEERRRWPVFKGINFVVCDFLIEGRKGAMIKLRSTERRLTPA
jgi:hypothetical protein